MIPDETPKVESLASDKLDIAMRAATGARARTLALIGPTAPAPVQPRDRRVVLVVDDDGQVAGLLRSALEAINATVIVCESIEEAFSALHERPIGCAVVDWFLPKRRGEEPSGRPQLLLRTLRMLGVDAVVWSGYDLTLQDSQGYRIVQKGAGPEEIVRWVATEEAASSYRLPPSELPRFEATDEHYRSMLTASIGRLVVHGTARWDGSLSISRSLDGLAPLRPRDPLWSVAMRERVRHRDLVLPVRKPTCRVVDAPHGLRYLLEERAVDRWTEYVLSFPGGWELTATPGAMALELASEIPDAFVFGEIDPSDPLPDGMFCQLVTRAIGRLEMLFEFPGGFEPFLWFPPLAFWGETPTPEPRNVIRGGSCAAFDWRTCGSSAKLVVERPLPGFTFALAWTVGPVERLEAARKAAMEGKP